MAKTVELPKMGESVDSGFAGRVLVSKGDKVEEGQALIEVETDKATTEIPSTASGTVTEIHVSEGDEVKTGSPLVTLDGDGGGDEEDDDTADESSTTATADADESDEAETKEEEQDEEDEEDEREKGEKKQKSAGRESKGKKKKAGKKKSGKRKRRREDEDEDEDERGADEDDGREEEERAEADDEKADDERKAKRKKKKDRDDEEKGTEKKGAEKKDAEKKDADSERGEAERSDADEDTDEEDTGEEDTGDEEDTADEDSDEDEREKEGDDREDDGGGVGATPSGGRSRGLASPSVRKFARELGLDVADIAQGSGDRITESDVKAHARDLIRRMRDAGLGRDPELPDFGQWGEIEHEPMSPIRRKTAEAMRHSWRTIPHVTHFDHADITDIEQFRERFAGRVEKAGGKLTITAVLVKILAEAVRYFPRLNSSVVSDRAELVIKRYVHVGVAVDTEAGLVLPVLRHADRKGLTEIAVELVEMAESARSGDLDPDDLQGGSISVTNVGGIGGRQFTPIVPWPQVAVLGVGRSFAEPRARDGEIDERTILPVGVSYDHRAVDGAEVARFVRWICDALEDPMRLTMEPD